MDYLNQNNIKNENDIGKRNFKDKLSKQNIDNKNDNNIISIDINITLFFD